MASYGDETEEYGCKYSSWHLPSQTEVHISIFELNNNKLKIIMFIYSIFCANNCPHRTKRFKDMHIRVEEILTCSNYKPIHKILMDL